MATPTAQIPLRNCSEHKGKQLDLYCNKCDTPVCVKCLLSIHKGHNVCELVDIIPQTRKDIQSFINRTEQNDLVQVREYIKSTDTLLKDNSSIFENLSEKLKVQTEQLKKDLDRLTSETLAMYKEMEQENIRLIKKYKQDMEMYNRELKKRVEKCKAALQQGSHIEIHDARCEIHSQISPPVKPVLSPASFTPNTNPQHHLELALGNIVQDRSVKTSGGQGPSSSSSSVTMYKLLSDTKVLEEWISPVFITAICPTTDGQVWTSDWGTLTLLGRKGEVIQKVKHNASIKDKSLSPTTQTLWVCDTEIIMELVSGQLTQRFGTGKKILCICVTASDHVLVGMAKNITKFTKQGQMVLTTSVTGTGKPLVCSPQKISECPVTHNVAVVDRNHKNDGGDGKQHVTVMDTDFNELFVYKGDIPTTSQKGAGTFDPCGVVYDGVGNIIIGDGKNNRVLLISGRGEFLRIIQTGTFLTRVVVVDKEDVLWVAYGLYGSSVKLLQYKQCVTTVTYTQ